MTRSLNKVILIGNLTDDPILRQTKSETSVCNFKVATNRDYINSDGERQEIPEYHSIVAWGKLADICANILKKGDRAYLEGRMESRKFVDKTGVERSVIDIVINDMILLPRGIQE